MQQIIITGNLGKDPDLRYMPNGDKSVNMSVAVNEDYTNHDGEKIKKTSWFYVSAYRKQAENCDKYLRKGDKVLVIGKMGKPYAYQPDDSDKPAASNVIIANRVEFLKTSGQGNGQSDYEDDDDIPY